MRFDLIALSVCACLAAPAFAQSPAQAPCAGPEYHQFDFWIGDWDVFSPDGNKAGENRIEVIASKCALLENWTSAKGSEGKSLNSYDATDRKWHQLWVDATGGRLDLAGGLVGASMVLSSVAPVPDRTGAAIIHRITWTPNSDGTVRQHWQTSEDGGKTWKTAFDGKYVRRRERFRWGTIAAGDGPSADDEQVHAVRAVSAQNDRLLDVAGPRGA